MPELVLNNEQAEVVVQALGPVMLRDQAGNVIGHVEPKLTTELIAEIKRRADEGPRYTGQQVKSRLRALQEEWQRTGGFDLTYMREFLKKLNAADPGHFRTKESAA